MSMHTFSWGVVMSEIFFYFNWDTNIPLAVRDNIVKVDLVSLFFQYSFLLSIFAHANVLSDISIESKVNEGVFVFAVIL